MIAQNFEGTAHSAPPFVRESITAVPTKLISVRPLKDMVSGWRVEVAEMDALLPADLDISSDNLDTSSDKTPCFCTSVGTGLKLPHHKSFPDWRLQ